jgi:hypothetical protein
MKKTIFTFIFAIMVLFALNSCGVYTYATTQDDLYTEAYADVVRSDVDVNLVINYGTPYYYDGALLYYLYNGLYYYPFYYDNYWYMRAYRRPFNHLYYRPYFRPNRYDHRFHRDFVRPRTWRVDPGKHRGPNRFGAGNRPRPNVDSRPNNPPRPSVTKPTKPTRPSRPSVTRPTRPTQPQRSVTPRPATPQRSTPPVRSNSNGRFGGRR